MITTTYRSGNCRPEREGDRFVRTVRPCAQYAWCVRDAIDHRYDVQQGFCDREDLPDNVRRAADARFGFIPSYVEWPRT
jgi:hypothetical protein